MSRATRNSRTRALYIGIGVLLKIMLMQLSIFLDVNKL